MLALLRYLVHAFTLNSSPRHMSLGLAMGIMTGMVPTNSLLFVVLAVLMILSPVNLAVGLLTTAGVSQVSHVVDPITHSLGQSILAFSHFQPTLAHFYGSPWTPWIGLDNTVVVGGLIVGSIQFYFSCRLSEPLFAWCHAGVAKLVVRDSVSLPA